MTYGKDLKVPTEKQLTYNSYLRVHDLLSLQKLESDPPQHDETLFIIIHQVYELWFKQILHEFSRVIQYLQQDKSFLLIKTLGRIHKIQQLLVEQVDVLETMTPNDFNYFRSKLNPASGFQSHQFRMLEFRLGLKDSSYLKYYQNDPLAKMALESCMEEKSIYDHFLEFFAKKSLNIPKEVLQRDPSEYYQSSLEVAKEFARVYQSPEDFHELYEILELMMDFDQKLLLWRYRHVQMVQRVIGITMGTGGSAGVQYLRTTLDKRAFPEIWEARQHIITDLGSGEKP